MGRDGESRTRKEQRNKPVASSRVQFEGQGGHPRRRPQHVFRCLHSLIDRLRPRHLQNCSLQARSSDRRHAHHSPRRPRRHLRTKESRSTSNTTNHAIDLN